MTKKSWRKPRLFRWGKRPPISHVYVTVDTDYHMAVVNAPPARGRYVMPTFVFDDAHNRILIVYWLDREVLPSEAERAWWKPHIVRFVLMHEGA